LISALTLDERTPPTEFTYIVIEYNIAGIKCQGELGTGYWVLGTEKSFDF
jgi:hypothetical protein